LLLSEDVLFREIIVYCCFVKILYCSLFLSKDFLFCETSK